MSLTSRIADGAVWLTAQALTTRVVSFAAQIALAWLLLPEHFGRISLALTVSSMFDAIRSAGLNSVYVQRYRRADIWTAPCHHLSVAVGIVACVAMLVIAPILAWIYQDTIVGWLVAVLALAAPFSSLGIIPAAKLTAEMRFRELAAVSTGEVVVVQALTIVMALLGFEELSFAVPRVIAAFGMQYAMRRLAKLGPLGKLRPRRWKYLLGDGSHALVTGILQRALMQVDYLVLGLIVSKQAVGHYFMAFSLSVQAIMLVTVNFMQVLFPGLATLTPEPQRQCNAFFRASKAMALAGVPVCALQAVGAAPAVRLVLEPEWLPVIPLAQVLSVATAVHVCGQAWGQLLRARGDFATPTWLAGASLVYFTGLIAAGALIAGPLGAAFGVVAHHATMGPVQVYVATRRIGGTLLQVADLYVRPLLIAALAFVPAWWLMRTLGGHDVLRLVNVTVVGGVLYLLAARVLAPESFREMWGIVANLVARVRARGSA